MSDAKLKMVRSTVSSRDEMLDDLLSEWNGHLEDPAWITQAQLAMWVQQHMAHNGMAGQPPASYVNWIWRRLPDPPGSSGGANGMRVNVDGRRTRVKVAER